MLSKSIIPFLSVASLLISTTLALPARTHCRCTILSTSRSPNPSTNPDLPSHSTDICNTLGPELENFRHSKPELYSSFISTSTISSDPTTTTIADGEERPLSTTVLLQLAAKNGFQNLGVVLPSAPTERPRERIVCRAETEAFSAYSDSLFTLFAIQVVVVIAVLACIAEIMTLVLDWMTRRTRTQEQIPPKAALRLSGDERLLRAFPAVEVLFSPGAEKKLRAYESPNWTLRLSTEKREFDAYEDEDDEMSRPVM